MTKELSPSKKIGTKTIYNAFLILKENGGELSIRELLKKI